LMLLHVLGSHRHLQLETSFTNSKKMPGKPNAIGNKTYKKVGTAAEKFCVAVTRRRQGGGRGEGQGGGGAARAGGGGRAWWMDGAEQGAGIFPAFVRLLTICYYIKLRLFRNVAPCYKCGLQYSKAVPNH
jgi:hypothetical protein